MNSILKKEKIKGSDSMSRYDFVNKCPYCKKPMKITHHKVSNFCDWFDYEGMDEYTEWDSYRCKDCKIEYDENKDEWTLPYQFQPTEKQIRFARWIAEFVNESTKDLVTKQQYYSYIKRNKNEFERLKEEAEKDPLYCAMQDEYWRDYAESMGYDESMFF